MNTTDRLVSVVIPTFNYGGLVSEAVDSVLAQSYCQVEIIVVDDGSEDDTRQRLERYGDRIVYCYQANSGLSAARNKGITLARGELIALLDSDDAFHPEKLSLQVKFLTTHPEVGLVGTDAFTDQPVRWTDSLPDDLEAVSEEVSLDQVVVKSRFSPSSVMFRRECLTTVGRFDPKLKSVEDRDMWIRIAARHRMATIHLPLTWYRLTPGSMSQNAVRMEHFEQVVLDKAFAMPELRGRWILRKKAYGLAACSAAYMYLASGEPKSAWRCMLLSFLRWPLPIRVPDVRSPFGRTRLLLRLSKAGVARETLKTTSLR